MAAWWRRPFIGRVRLLPVLGTVTGLGILGGMSKMMAFARDSDPNDNNGATDRRFVTRQAIASTFAPKWGYFENLCDVDGFRAFCRVRRCRNAIRADLVDHIKTYVDPPDDGYDGPILEVSSGRSSSGQQMDAHRLKTEALVRAHDLAIANGQCESDAYALGSAAIDLVQQTIQSAQDERAQIRANVAELATYALRAAQKAQLATVESEGAWTKLQETKEMRDMHTAQAKVNEWTAILAQAQKAASTVSEAQLAHTAAEKALCAAQDAKVAAVLAEQAHKQALAGQEHLLTLWEARAAACKAGDGVAVRNTLMQNTNTGKLADSNTSKSNTEKSANCSKRREQTPKEEEDEDEEEDEEFWA